MKLKVTITLEVGPPGANDVCPIMCNVVGEGLLGTQEEATWADDFGKWLAGASAAYIEKLAATIDRVEVGGAPDKGAFH